MNIQVNANNPSHFAAAEALENFLLTEIANEASGGVSPATLESAVDSLWQAPDDVIADWFHGQPVAGLVALARLLATTAADTTLAEVVYG